MNVFCISGSLREASSNMRLLYSLMQVAPGGVTVRMFSLLETVPIFHPDKQEVYARNESLIALREGILWADLVLFSSPEYAHSLPGVVKNALDHLVPTGELSGKKAAMVTPSLRGQMGQEALKTVLLAADARVLLYDEGQAAFPVGAGEGYLTIDDFWQAILSLGV